MQHRLETIGSATSPRPLKNKSFHSPALRRKDARGRFGAEWAGGRAAVPFPPASPACPARGRPGGGGAPGSPGRAAAEPKAAGAGRRGRGRRGGRRGRRARWPAEGRECPRRGARAARWPRPGDGSPSGLRLRPPEGRAPVAAVAAGGVSGRRGPRRRPRCWRRASGRGGGRWEPARGVESESFLARGPPGRAEVGGIERRGSRPRPCQPVKVGADGVSFSLSSPGFASLTSGHWVKVRGAARGMVGRDCTASSSESPSFWLTCCAVVHL